MLEDVTIKNLSVSVFTDWPEPEYLAVNPNEYSEPLTISNSPIVPADSTEWFPFTSNENYMF